MPTQARRQEEAERPEPTNGAASCAAGLLSRCNLMSPHGQSGSKDAQVADLVRRSASDAAGPEPTPDCVQSLPPVGHSPAEGRKSDQEGSSFADASNLTALSLGKLPTQELVILSPDQTEMSIKLSLVDLRWAAKKGFWDGDKRQWNEAMGGMLAYLEQRRPCKGRKWLRCPMELLTPQCAEGGSPFAQGGRCQCRSGIFHGTNCREEFNEGDRRQKLHQRLRFQRSGAGERD